MHVVVDRSLCQAYANCVVAAPAVFELDDDDPAVHVIQAEPPAALHESVRQAARLCPVQAITVIEE